MRPLLITVGSRGDVQQFLALARGLLAAGHRPVLAAPRRFEPLATRHGVEFVPLYDEMLELQNTVKGQGVRAAVTAARSVRPMVRRLLDDQAALTARSADVVVYHPKSLGGPYVAEKLGVPAFAGLLIPLYVPTSAFPSPIFPVRPPGPLNRASWRIAAAVEAPYRSVIRTWRTEALGLRDGFVPMAELVRTGNVLHAWSPHLLPAPADWPDSARPIGFWTMPADDTWAPPERLARFLDEGEPPVYVGFGSSTTGDPDVLTATVLEGVRLAGRRAVLATGWGALRPGADADDVLVMEEAPHDWLLPRVAVAVHHGGVGTAAAALRAGVPQVVRPFVGDQPFWASRLHRLGVAPEPLRGRLTAARLAAAIEKAAELAPAARVSAGHLGAEDGVAAAVARIAAAS
ncbi:glycosyltransferase family 1 protein [Nonomuraea sp. KC401]|uniref:glycosyltransferase n=1 Tax=unclassified Nonomuraea TaxID=2593643 RepID=UPI0010FD3F61|nr:MULTISPECIES: glycosyltransferase [unclassified Nonomuraea]NBE95172.1 glycosyltransferase [Nonomuraea sp. K271]TLF73425.1 glycosyltransferase family 1 protein [Nonomuraea sp. KC401]